jgi:hypothetical protein
MTGLRAGIAIAVAALISAAAAQQSAPRAVPMRPPLFLSESWKPLPTPPDDHGAWPATQDGVSNPNLELTLYGTTSKEIQLVAGRGGSNVVPTNLWTGTTTTPSAVALRDRNNFVDLSAPLAKIRWVVRTSGFHQAWPIVKLADGTWLVGDHTDASSLDWLVGELSIASVRWLKLDPERLVTTGNFVDKPDLSNVDEVGFVDLMPASGHGPGGWSDVAQIEVYGNAVKRP